MMDLTQVLMTKPVHSLAVLNVRVVEFGGPEHQELAKQGWRVTEVHEEGDPCMLVHQKWLY